MKTESTTLSIIENLVKMANELDAQGKFESADLVDSTLAKIALMQPIGKPFTKGGKTYQKFNTEKGVVVKEVDTLTGRLVDTLQSGAEAVGRIGEGMEQLSRFDEWNPLSQYSKSM